MTPAESEAHRRAIMLALALVRAAYARARAEERRCFFDPSAASSALDVLEQEIEKLLTTEPTP